VHVSFISLRHPTKRYYYYEDKEPLPYFVCFFAARQHGGSRKRSKIGMAIDDLRLERWQKDRDIFVKKPNRWVPRFLSSRLTVMKKPRCRKLKI
jgi:hypothetical protein